MSSTLSITTNTSALSVQRNLAAANDRASSSLAKLSSGSRVPTSKDDAASLAIGSRLEAEVAGLNQASVNASQATSMLQIADGALSEVNSILVRLNSLAVQASSGQLSDSERSLLDSEYQQLLEEVDRISQDTEFNGNQLINGGDIEVTNNETVAGDLAGAGIDISFSSTKINGAQDTNDDGTLDKPGDVFSVQYDSTTETFTVLNETTGDSFTQSVTAMLDSEYGIGSNPVSGRPLEVAFVDATSGLSVGVTINLDENFDRTSDYNYGRTVTPTGGSTPTYTNLALVESADPFDSDTLSALMSLDPSVFDAATGNLTLNINDDGAANVTIGGLGLEFNIDGGGYAAGPQNIQNAAAQTIAVRIAGTTTELFTITADAVAVNAAAASTLDVPFANFVGAQSNVLDEATFDYQIGTGTENSDVLSVKIEGASNESLGIDGTSVATQEEASNAIDLIGFAIDKLQDVRANVGASLSRLEFASSNIAVAIENTESAKSGLLDVDIATETTKFTAEQVIVQAGVSLLAQANQRPETLLKLLG